MPITITSTQQYSGYPRYKNYKGRNKTLLFTGTIILCVKNLNESIYKLLD